MPRRTEFPSSLSPLEVGDPRKIGPYRTVGRLGAGGMGAVYGAVDNDGRCLAVKLVHREFADNDEFRARFAREVRLVERVDARCTPAFAGADPDAETPWLATEYVPGPTLREHVVAEGPLSGGMLRALAAGLAEALHAIHSAGIVHRDLKPSNVILSPDGPKVLDFGIARAIDGTGITRTGGLMGSPGWIAPERFHGAVASPEADIFAWGSLVAFAATGHAPFGSGTPQVVAARTMREQPDLTGLPQVLWDVTALALDKEPSRRPTAIAILRGLGSSAEVPHQTLVEPSTLVDPLLASEWLTPPVTRGADWATYSYNRRHSRWTWAVAVTTAGLLVGASGLWLITDSRQESPMVPNNDVSGATEEPETGTDASSGTAEHHPENVARDPGSFEHTFPGGESVLIEMRAVEFMDTEVEFTGTANYTADSGSIEFGSTLYMAHNYDDNEHPSTDMRAQVWPIPGEVFGVLSPENPTIEFTMSISTEDSHEAGALFYSTDSGEFDPHLCYRSEPYAETGTQFLHNEGDSWRDCAADPYE